MVAYGQIRSSAEEGKSITTVAQLRNDLTTETAWRRPQGAAARPDRGRQRLPRPHLTPEVRHVITKCCDQSIFVVS